MLIQVSVRVGTKLVDWEGRHASGASCCPGPFSLELVRATGREGGARLGLGAFLLAQPFMEAREKKAVGTCPRGKQLKATPHHLSSICPPTAPALSCFSDPVQCLGLGGSGESS